MQDHIFSTTYPLLYSFVLKKVMPQLHLDIESSVLNSVNRSIGSLVVISDVAILLMLSLLALYARSYGMKSLWCYYLMPWFVSFLTIMIP